MEWMGSIFALALAILYPPHSTDRDVIALASRIHSLADKEPPRARLDTEIRLAAVLAQSPVARAEPTSMTEPEAEQLLQNLEHGTDDPIGYDHLARLRRAKGWSIGVDNPSVRVREALAEIEELRSAVSDFSLSTLEGPEVSLTSLRGRTVLLTFWATWCIPCRQELLLFEQLKRQNPNLTVLAISDEKPEVVQTYVRNAGLTFTIALDPERRLFQRFRIQGLPESKIIDPTGRVRANFGPILEPALRHLLWLSR
jgi:peroxiredoxin